MFRTKCKEHDHSAFYNFLNMEQNHKNNDCYFFYYSTCTKGDSCAFRHEPSALGCEVMCSYWQQGNCLNEKCNFRHMELKKNRKSIPCYWESQRVGCKKPHCPFMHTQPRPVINETTPTKTNELPVKPVNQEWSNRPDDGKFDGSGTESDQGRGSSEAGSFIGSPAETLIVNFDEGTLSLPSSLQTNMNLRSTTLGIRNRMTIPIDIDIPGRLNLGTSVASGLNVTQTSVQSMQHHHHHHHHQQQHHQQQQPQQQQHQQQNAIAAAVCHHAAAVAVQQHQYGQQNRYHPHTHGQTIQLQSQPSTSQIQRSNYSNALPDATAQNQRARYPFPFGLSYTSYRRY